jgi:phosphoenolpyruvate carboxylase
MTGQPTITVAKRDASKDAPLIEDIRLLGQILGTAIREQEGDAAFERIEKIRRLSVAFERDADAVAGRTLDTLLRSLTSEEAVLVVRAFSYFSHLANIAEDRHYIRRREAHEQDASSRDQTGSLASTGHLLKKARPIPPRQGARPCSMPRTRLRGCSANGSICGARANGTTTRRC